jgi:hypothetical protein
VSGIFATIAKGVNWVTIFYVSFGFTLLVIWAKIFDVSPEKMIRTIVEELKEVASANWSAKSINALGVICSLVILLLYKFADGLADAIDALAAAQGKAAEASSGAMIFGVCTVIVLTFGSVLIVRKLP